LLGRLAGRVALALLLAVLVHELVNLDFSPVSSMARMSALA
jgi:hypothetical protein